MQSYPVLSTKLELVESVHVVIDFYTRWRGEVDLMDNWCLCGVRKVSCFHWEANLLCLTKQSDIDSQSAFILHFRAICDSARDEFVYIGKRLFDLLVEKF